MTLKIYVGTASEITARFAGVPDSAQAVVESVSSKQVFAIANPASFAVGQSIIVGNEKGLIAGLSGPTITLKSALLSLPSVGSVVKHYDADYTKYRLQGTPFVFVDDRKTGGETGTPLGQDLRFADYDGQMVRIPIQSRISIFEDQDPVKPLFAGVITSSQQSILTKQLSGSNLYITQVEAKGYQWEADSVGIEEQPFTNVNAGEFLRYLLNKWTPLQEGFIDTANSPTIDFIRIGNYKRFSDIGSQLAQLWPGSEFFIDNDHTVGKVYFRQAAQALAPMTLSSDYFQVLGVSSDQYVRTKTDYSNVYNIIRFPYYREQWREPDFHSQVTTANEAYLKTSVTLNGQPINLEETDLLFDDFSDGELQDAYTEDDLSNNNPPTGFNSVDGYLIEGENNQVVGLHFLDTSSVSPTVKFGDIGRITDPGETEPFTGEERQLIFAQEIVVNTLGDAIILGIIDQSTAQTTTVSGSTTTQLNVASTAGFAVDDRLTVAGQKTYITNIGVGNFTVSPALSGSPGAGVTVEKHRLALSRVKFGVLFKSTGDLKYIKDGVETAFGTPRTYTAGPTTYSLRLYMQAFETTVASGVSSTGVTLADATNFTTGDVVELFTQGGRVAPEKRVITVSGSNITYAATNYTPSVGYRVRTLPKMVLQIKGGSFGSITGRTWTTLYTAANTWQTSATQTPDEAGIIVGMQKSLVGTLSLFQAKNPVPVTANIGSRYLHVGTQEIDSAEPDVDCIIRKVGSHYQLDFFSDTKALWSSGSTLELRFKERWLVHLEDKDIDSMRQIADYRGFSIANDADEQSLIRLGGRVLDTIQVLPDPITDVEATIQSQAVLEAAKQPTYSLEIRTNSVLDSLARSGQVIRSLLPDIPDLTIQRVEIEEIQGTKGSLGQTHYFQRVQAGSIDRLSDVLLRQTIKAARRIVLDDGIADDSFTKLQKAKLQDAVMTVDTFNFAECSSPTSKLYTDGSYTKLKCLKIPVTTTTSQPIGLLLAILGP